MEGQPQTPESHRLARSFLQSYQPLKKTRLYELGHAKTSSIETVVDETSASLAGLSSNSVRDTTSPPQFKSSLPLQATPGGGSGSVLSITSSTPKSIVTTSANTDISNVSEPRPQVSLIWLMSWFRLISFRQASQGLHLLVQPMLR